MLEGYKTYITAIIAALTAIGAYLTGDMTLAEALQTVFTALLAAFVRRGVKVDSGK